MTRRIVRKSLWGAFVAFSIFFWTVILCDLVYYAFLS